MPSRRHNPERSAWKGRSHKKGGERVSTLKDAPVVESGDPAEDMPAFSLDVLPPTCPGCGAVSVPLGTLGTRNHFRCSACGLECSNLV